MLKVQDQAIQKAIALLASAECKYKIITSSGEEFGELVAVVEKPRTKRKSMYPMGTISNYLIPYICKQNVSEIITIPGGQFDLEVLRSSIASWCSKNWGKDSHMSSINRANNTVEVLRYA